MPVAGLTALSKMMFDAGHGGEKGYPVRFAGHPRGTWRTVMK
jgi:hypothetical protein